MQRPSLLPSTITTVRLVTALLLLAPSTAAAQSPRLVVQKGANLRDGPSTMHGVIRVLVVGDTLELLTAHTSHDYLNVAAGADTGWVYSPLVELVESNVPVAVVPPSPTPTTVASAPAAYHGCALTGNPSPNGPNVSALRTLNEKKNRFHAPTDADVDQGFTLAALLQPGSDDTRFDDTRAGEIEGFVVNVKVGGVETVNCKATDPLFRDTHIEVADHMDAPEAERVIVEVTPRWRAAMQAAGIDWTTPALQALIGKKVRFRGWALFDEEHRAQARNTAPGNPSDWRATVWELHPVTSFVVTSP